MNLEQIKQIVTNEHAQPYRVTFVEAKPITVRLWKTDDGRVAIMRKKSRRWGHGLSVYDGIELWTSLTPVKRTETDWYNLFMKRAKDGVKMLTESGLWKDIKDEIEYFLALPESVQREMVNDIKTDCYHSFYEETRKEGGKYSWVKSYQIFESLASKTCWKSIAWRKWERAKMSRQVAECIKTGEHFNRSWENGYDNNLEVREDDGYKRGWYSEEYRGCGNGHYYLLFDATHAIFYEND